MKKKTNINQPSRKDESQELVTKGYLHAVLDDKINGLRKEVQQEFRNQGAKIEMLRDKIDIVIDMVKSTNEKLDTKADKAEPHALEERVEALERRG